MASDVIRISSLAWMREFTRTLRIRQLYRSFVYVPRAMSTIVINFESNLVYKKFIERLQLSVTEANGCPACSYQHTKMALRQSMSNEEIISFLSGGDEFIQPEEAKP